MVWQLLLAHFLADYPLQPRWLLAAKQRLWGLLLHVTIHFLTALLLVGDVRWKLLPPLVSLALVHFVIDLTKYRLAVTRPAWVRLPYFIDQALHLLTILGAARWIAAALAPAGAPAAEPWMIYLLGYLLATHVWFVTERMLTWHDKAYQQILETSLFPRMLSRALMLSALFLLGVGPQVAAVAWLPYRRESRGTRALLTDLAVAAAVAVLAKWAARAALGG
jgi:hypothetical protein